MIEHYVCDKIRENATKVTLKYSFDLNHSIKYTKITKIYLVRK
jgi:hypothetical protein